MTRAGLVFLLLSLAFVPAQAAGLSGDWKGSWTKNGDTVDVTMTFHQSGAGYSGSFDSDALQVAAIPLGDVTDEAGKLHFIIKGDSSTTVFDGKIAGPTITGRFSEGASKGSFVLRRAAAPTAIAARDVHFANGDVRLAGSLLLPPDIAGGAGRHPAILFLQGSGPEGRWANRYLAQKFARAGFVALIYDKRGVGDSAGDWRKVGFDALAADAVAGIRFLRTQPGVNSARVGIYGHSQGGTIAPLVAAKAGTLGFVIAAAAGGIAPDKVEIYSVENNLDLAHLSPADRVDARRYVQAVVGVAYDGASRAPLDAMAAKFKNRSWYFAVPPPGDSYWTVSRLIAPFDPSYWWRRVTAPVLLVYGAHDARVPPVQGAAAITSALKAGGNSRVTLKTYADADHLFTLVPPPYPGGWPRHEPGYADFLVHWAAMQGDQAPAASGR